MWDPMISLPGDCTFNLGSKMPQGGQAKKIKIEKKEGSFRRSFRRKSQKINRAFETKELYI